MPKVINSDWVDGLEHDAVAPPPGYVYVDAYNPDAGLRKVVTNTPEVQVNIPEQLARKFFVSRLGGSDARNPRVVSGQIHVSISLPELTDILRRAVDSSKVK